MALMEIVKKIIDGHEFEVTPSRVFLGFSNGKKIELKENVTPELFSDLFIKTCEVLGDPKYVHSYYGFIWGKNGEFLTLNTIEVSYNCEVTALFILKKLPIGKKLKYIEYIQIEEAVKQVFAEYSLNSSGAIHYYNGKFIFWGENSDNQCLLFLKKKSLEFYCSSKEPFGDGMTRVIPRYSRKARILLQDLSTVKCALKNCFIVE